MGSEAAWVTQRGTVLDTQQREIELGKLLLERLVRQVDKNVDIEWCCLPAAPTKVGRPDGWVLTLRRGSGEQHVEFANDELSDLRIEGSCGTSSFVRSSTRSPDWVTEIRRQINELSAEEDAGIREILLEALRIQGHDVN